jgi:hypothetical protein
MAYQSNISEIVRLKVEGLQKLSHPDEMLRTVAAAVLPELKKRVHIDGKGSDGSAIGTYSPGYMKLRTGNYANSGKVSRGANKGKLKDAGTISRGDRKGQPRPKYNRTADTKVIGSLTRQMENGLSIMPAGNGYGIGYTNPHNYDKSQWLEGTYKKDIWELTVEEKALAQQTAEDFIQQALNNPV